MLSSRLWRQGYGVWTVAIALIGALLIAVPPVWAAPSDLPLLTPAILQDRLQSTVTRDATPTVDLRGFTIDLRPENGEFRDRFYRQLRAALQAGNTPVGLDLSQSRIQGELDLTQLALTFFSDGDTPLGFLPEPAQQQLSRDRRRVSRLSQLSRSLLIQPQAAQPSLSLFRGPLRCAQTRFEGAVEGSDIFFLALVDGRRANFDKVVNWATARFNGPVNLFEARFSGALALRNAIFFDQVRFNQGQFQAEVDFQGAEFQASANFNQATFAAGANFNRSIWQSNADFAQTVWQGAATLIKSNFQKALFLTETRLNGPMILRQARFGEPLNLRGAIVSNQLDFGDAQFSSGVYINVSGMEFSAAQSELLGSPGDIGQRLSAPVLTGNETLLRNLVFNFRRLEQVSDANQVEYTTERLRLRDLHQRLFGLNVNSAPQRRLMGAGFSSEQATAIGQARQAALLLSAADFLALDAVDLATYVKVRDRIVFGPPLGWVARLRVACGWLTLNGLLVLSHYGTSIGLALSVGLLAIAWYALLFWLIDRYRRAKPTPIVPTAAEIVTMLSSFVLIASLSGTLIWRLGDRPGLTLMAIAVVSVPVPLGIIGILYRRGRYHDLMDSSYFVEDGSLRQLRLLIARLPIIPKFPFFRDRYTPILWQRRWSWLNYYDFSINNWLKFGFNDIRLRDEQLPGLITAMVWYQWCLGILYIALLLWTLSRTIPGLNLLLYF
ncbi:MAG: pentapeptide repeat-containing protein [Cyanobacteria bacterium P01_D01_bin.128]